MCTINYVLYAHDVLKCPPPLRCRFLPLVYIKIDVVYAHCRKSREQPTTINRIWPRVCGVPAPGVWRSFADQTGAFGNGTGVLADRTGAFADRTLRLRTEHVRR